MPLYPPNKTNSKYIFRKEFNTRAGAITPHHPPDLGANRTVHALTRPSSINQITPTPTIIDASLKNLLHGGSREGLSDGPSKGCKTEGLRTSDFTPLASPNQTTKITHGIRQPTTQSQPPITGPTLNLQTIQYMHFGRGNRLLVRRFAYTGIVSNDQTTQLLPTPRTPGGDSTSGSR